MLLSDGSFQLDGAFVLLSDGAFVLLSDGACVTVR